MLLLRIPEKVSHQALKRQEKGGHGGRGREQEARRLLIMGGCGGHAPQAQLERADQMLQSNGPITAPSARFTNRRQRRTEC